MMTMDRAERVQRVLDTMLNFPVLSGRVTKGHAEDIVDALDNVQHKKINISDIQVGQVVCEMHGHTTNNFGLLKGWKVGILFEIDEDVFNAMSEKLPAVDGQTTRVIMNKFARVVSIVEDYHDNVKAVMVIYSYDHRYYSTALMNPND